MLKIKWMQVLIGVFIGLLLLGAGIVIAANTIWSSTTSITIIALEPPGGGGGGGGGGSDPPTVQSLEIISVTLSDGVLEDGIWSANFTQGVGGSSSIIIHNPRSTAAQIEMLVDGLVVVEVDGQGVEVANPAAGVSLFMFTDINETGTIMAGSNALVMWSFHVSDTAELGALPNISLEIREK